MFEFIMPNVPHGLTKDQINEVNAYHEAGHACVMELLDIPILCSARLENGSAQIVPDPTHSAKDLKGLYSALLVFRASRYSQKLAPHNNMEAEICAFDPDNVELGNNCANLYNLFQKGWVKDRPTREVFTIEVLSIVDIDLGNVFRDPLFQNVVQGVANQFITTPAMDGGIIKNLVEEQCRLLGAKSEFSCYDIFTDLCVRDTTS